MSTQDLKLSIQKLVDKTNDPELLQGIYLVLKQFIAADASRFSEFEADGTPVSDAELIQSVTEADADIEAGNFITLEEMKAKFGYRRQPPQI